VKGPHDDAFSGGSDELEDPLFHLAGGLVGKGQGEQLLGLGEALGKDIGEAVGEYPGFAAARTGDDHLGALGVFDGGPLGGVQVLKKSRFRQGGKAEKFGK